ncbi:response regulator transcription factor [Streptomyces sp. NBC_01803]|uniref:response regulator transcription factor n=1 Tax=Streptomyces sp. NBC_01803 TaxID=2975946 RepID=UPI003FA35DEE
MRNRTVSPVFIGRGPERAALSEGSPGRGGALLVLAHAVAAELGARPLTAEIERLAQRARLSRVAQDPEGVEPDGPERFGLTWRERDVLSLVAAGRSNRRIARELFISPTTASAHVSNMLAKLEVSGRGRPPPSPTGWASWARTGPPRRGSPRSPPSRPIPSHPVPSLPARTGRARAPPSLTA